MIFGLVFGAGNFLSGFLAIGLTSNNEAEQTTYTMSEGGAIDNLKYGNCYQHVKFDIFHNDKSLLKLREPLNV